LVWLLVAAGVSVLAWSGAGLGAVDRAATAGLPASDRDAIEAKIKDALAKERAALLDLGRGPEATKAADATIASSTKDLLSASETLQRDGFGHSDAWSDLISSDSADSHDIGALYAIEHDHQPGKAVEELGAAIAWKKRALGAVAELPAAALSCTAPAQRRCSFVAQGSGGLMLGTTATGKIEVLEDGQKYSFVAVPNGTVGPVPESPHAMIALINDSNGPATMTERPTSGSTGPSTASTPAGSSTPTPSPTPGGSSSPIGPLEACVNLSTTGSTTVANVAVLDHGAAGLKGTVSFDAQGIHLTDAILFSTTGVTAAPFVVRKPGTATFTITVPLGNGKSQHLTLPYTLNSVPKTTVGCTPRQ
jgi:hypothetical protein